MNKKIKRLCGVNGDRNRWKSIKFVLNYPLTCTSSEYIIPSNHCYLPVCHRKEEIVLEYTSIGNNEIFSMCHFPLSGNTLQKYTKRMYITLQPCSSILTIYNLPQYSQRFVKRVDTISRDYLEHQ